MLSKAAFDYLSTTLTKIYNYNIEGINYEYIEKIDNIKSQVETLIEVKQFIESYNGIMYIINDNSSNTQGMIVIRISHDDLDKLAFDLKKEQQNKYYHRDKEIKNPNIEINATKMREIADTKNDTLTSDEINKMLDLINTAANNGEYSIRYTFPDNCNHIQILNTLNNLGFNILIDTNDQYYIEW